jgi:hypothetical protein
LLRSMIVSRHRVIAVPTPFLFPGSGPSTTPFSAEATRRVELIGGRWTNLVFPISAGRGWNLSHL